MVGWSHNRGKNRKGCEAMSGTGQDGVFQQNLEEQAEPGLFQICLLFRERGERPSAEALKTALEERLGACDLVGRDALITLAVKGLPVEYKGGEQVPAQALMTQFSPFDGEKLTPIQRSQLWDCPEGAALLEECRWQLTLTDFMARGLPYRERCALLAGWLDAVLSLTPECAAVWVPSAWKLLTPEKIRAHGAQGASRFLYWGLNARLFTIQGTQDMVVDTLGMYALGLPDVQYHFHGLDPNWVVNHAYNAAAYLFENDVPIRSGETIDGLTDGWIDQKVQWRCQYEDALIQPGRQVLDICPGEWASGGR